MPLRNFYFYSINRVKPQLRKTSSSRRKQNTFATNATATTRHRRDTPPRDTPCHTDRARKPFSYRFQRVRKFSISSAWQLFAANERQRYERETGPPHRSRCTLRLLSIQFLVIRYLETISRVVLRVYTTGHSLASLSADPHTLRKQFACGGVARVAGTRDRNNDDHLSSSPIQLRSFSLSLLFSLQFLLLSLIPLTSCALLCLAILRCYTVQYIRGRC